MIAAIYARKSTEQNGADADAKSVQRQIENARSFAAAKGWTVADAHIFADDAVSGAETKKLVNRKRLLDAISSGPPFKVLVMRDASRFSRRDGDEAFGELKRIAQARVEIWFYQDGTRFSYGTFGDNVVGFVRAEMNAEFRRQVAKWTREAMVRKAQAGHVTGGRVFGYDNVRVDGHVERRINPTEAAVVRRIFDMAAAGAGFKRIAKQLNDERVPCPRAQRGRPAGWGPSSIRPALFRTLYKGVITWGKTRGRNESGERRQLKQNADQWLTVPAPHLRIVSDDLWEAAHRRIAAAAAVYLKATGGKPFGRPVVGLESRYLLTGLACCGACRNDARSGLMGHSGTSGRRRMHYYVCTGFHNKGRTICSNGLPLPMREADDAVLTKLREFVLRPDIVEGALTDALALLNPQSDALAARRADLHGQLQVLHGEMTRLTTAIATGGELASLIEALKDRERQRTALQQRMDSLAGLAQVSRVDMRRVERDLRARVKDWRELLRRQAPISRQIVLKLLDGRLVFTPHEDRSWKFTGLASVGKLLEGIVLPQVWRPHGDSLPTVYPTVKLCGVVLAA